MGKKEDGVNGRRIRYREWKKKISLETKKKVMDEAKKEHEMFPSFTTIAAHAGRCPKGKSEEKFERWGTSGIQEAAGNQAGTGERTWGGRMNTTKVVLFQRGRTRRRREPSNKPSTTSMKKRKKSAGHKTTSREQGKKP